MAGQPRVHAVYARACLQPERPPRAALGLELQGGLAPVRYCEAEGSVTEQVSWKVGAAPPPPRQQRLGGVADPL